jgi:hypothetical protein
MQDNQLALIALVAALAVLGVVVVTVATLTIQLQEAEARGCSAATPAPNASKLRCFKG